MIWYIADAVLQLLAMLVLLLVVVVPTDMFVKWFLNSFESQDTTANRQSKGPGK